MFNALKYIKGLEAVGFRRDQAEAQVQLVIDAIEDEVATKSDIAKIHSDFATLRSEIAAQFASVRAEFQAEFASVRAEFRAEFANVRAEFRQQQTEVIFKLGALVVICATLSVGALGLLIKL